MNILLLNEYAGPEEFCPPYRPVYLAREWVRHGHEVTIVCGSYSHLFLKQPIVNQVLTHLVEQGVHFWFVRTPPYTGNALGRIRNMLLFASRLRAHSSVLTKTRKPDLVISGSVHGLDCYPARSLARKLNVPYVREVRDLWPLTITDLGGKSKLHPFVLLLQHAENYSYHHADRVITTLSHSLLHMQRHGLAPSKWRFIPQGTSEVTDRKPLAASHSELLKCRRVEGKFLIGYAGGHGVANALPTLLEAAGKLDQQRFAFVLIGQGPEKPSLQKMARDRRLANFDFLDPVPKSQVPAFLEAIDLAYLGWQKRRIYQFGVSPNKLMDYMLAAKPILHACDVTPDLIEQYGCGVRVPAEAPSAVAEAILALSKLPEAELQLLGAKGRAAVLKHHNYTSLAVDYLAALPLQPA